MEESLRIGLSSNDAINKLRQGLEAALSSPTDEELSRLYNLWAGEVKDNLCQELGKDPERTLFLHYLSETFDSLHDRDVRDTMARNPQPLQECYDTFRGKKAKFYIGGRVITYELQKPLPNEP